jgi:hypothetical protein
MKTYEVEFNYYQYNSGMGDNGTYTHKCIFDDIVEAKEFKNKIDLAYEAYRNEDYKSEIYEWMIDFIADISYGGFIKSKAKIFEVTRIEIK